jgi:hypothetical protein
LIDELIGEVVVGAARVILGVLVEVGGELLIKGPGYLICRLFARDVDMDGGTVVVSGFLVWIIIGTVAYAIARHVHHPAACVGPSGA